LAENVNGSWAKVFIATATGVIEWDSTNGIMFKSNDHHGDTRIITNSSGLVAGRLDMYPYGEIWSETGTTNKYKNTGKERDTESGNDYFGARYYWNGAGRWLGVDRKPGDILNPQRLNRYAYVRNDPITYVDPDGNEESASPWLTWLDCSRDPTGQDCILIWVPNPGYRKTPMPVGPGNANNPAIPSVDPFFKNAQKFNQDMKDKLEKFLQKNPDCDNFLKRFDSYDNSKTSIRFFDLSSGSPFARIAVNFMAPMLHKDLQLNRYSSNFTLGQYLGNDDAAILAGWLNVNGSPVYGVLPIVLLSSTGQGGATLGHEFAHLVTQMTDIDLAGVLGLGTFDNRDDASGAVRNFFEGGCKKKK
jgi:RHS repeat-associated protein